MLHFDSEMFPLPGEKSIDAKNLVSHQKRLLSNWMQQWSSFDLWPLFQDNARIVLIGRLDFRHWKSRPLAFKDIFNVR